MVWRNTKNPSASYYDDSRRCKKEAEADNSLPGENVVGAVALGMRLAQQEGECMASRGWKFVPTGSASEASDAIRAPSASAVPVNIESVPAGAEIYVDNSFIGTAPLESFRLEPGEHVLEAKKVGFTIWSRTMSIQPGTPVNVRIELERAGSK
jgi:PEGA domain